MFDGIGVKPGRKREGRWERALVGVWVDEAVNENEIRRLGRLGGKGNGTDENSID
jgi:hypothetical protein